MSSIKQIAYIELDCHSEVVNNFMTLMDDTAMFHVDYYLADAVIDELHLLTNENIISAETSNILSLLKAKYNLVIIGTANRDFNLYEKIVKKFNTCVIVHNISFVKTTADNIIKKLFLRNTTLALRLIKSGLFRKDAFHNHVQKLVLDEALVLKNKELNLSFFPLSFSQTSSQIKDVGKIKIVIPGTVSQKRRDYRHILTNIKQFTSHISITFLGKASGEELEWLEKTKKEISPNVELIYFTENVPQRIFDEVMFSSDVIWSPIQQTIDFCGVTEYYGKSKISGNINDAIKFGKPILLPDFYESDLPFVFNEEDNVEQQLIELSKKDFSFTKYSKETVLKQLENTLLRLLAE